MSVNKFDLVRRNYDRLIKPEQLMNLNIGFVQDDKFAYPFFEYKSKVGTYVFKLEAQSSLVTSTSATFKVEGIDLINQWLDVIGVNKINPDHFVVGIRPTNEPESGVTLNTKGVLFAKFVMVITEVKLKPDVGIEDLELDMEDDERYFIEKRPVFWLTKFKPHTL